MTGSVFSGDKPSDAGAVLFVPGALVRRPAEPGWGIGQVQSAIGNRVTVNFQYAGKEMIDTSVIKLEAVDDPVR
ncbi:MAG: DUF3553 domain-containing protein [Alphaproteobacteria bacterium]|nr:DUF3553 domain-containing protein [Alphaproteobacteria bacterium]